MRDLNKWFAGLATSCLIALVTTVMSIKSEVTSVATEMKLSNASLIENVNINTKGREIHNLRLSTVEQDVIELKVKDQVHTKYNNVIDKLLPVVIEIKTLMKEAQRGN